MYMYDYRHTSSNHIGRRFFIKERERRGRRLRRESIIIILVELGTGAF